MTTRSTNPMIRTLRMLVLFLLVQPVILGQTVTPDTVGQLFLEDARRPGTLTGRSSTIPNDEIVRTQAGFAIVRLDNGQVVRLDQGTSARLTSDGAGTVRIKVHAGRISIVGESTRLLRGGAGGTVEIRPTSIEPDYAVERLIADDLGPNATPKQLERRKRRAGR